MIWKTAKTATLPIPWIPERTVPRTAAGTTWTIPAETAPRILAEILIRTRLRTPAEIPARTKRRTPAGTIWTTAAEIKNGFCSHMQ